MIIFQTEKHQIDLSNLPITFNEVNDFFSSNITKSFTYPFDIDVNDDVFEKISLINIDNISKYTSKIYGTLIIDTNFYEAYISINEVKADEAELTIFYGKETLDVFEKNITDLPFPTTSISSSLPVFAKAQITKSWPEATHNFPMVFREGIKEDANYDLFENFINHYKFNGTDWEFPINSIDLIEGESTIVNRNVMAPFPYLMEVLRVAFKTEGLEVRGSFADNTFNHKILMVPKKYFKEYSTNELLDYSFSNYTSQEVVENKTVNVYRQVHTPTAAGTYTLAMRINMSSYVARYFKLTVVQNGVTLYSAFSENKDVNINETLNINVYTAAFFQDIEVELRLYYQTTEISAFNRFNYRFTEGQLNMFPTSYNIVDYLPKMSVKKLLNMLKTMFNISFTYTENAVYIDYLESQMEQFIFKDLSHTEQEKPQRILNKNNLFKISYPDKQEILVDKLGQTYSEASYVSEEIEKIEIDILPLKVSTNLDVLTAVYPTDDEDVMLMLYNGVVENKPVGMDKIDNQSLSLQDTYDLYYRKWLTFRANAETYRDKFIIHKSERINITEGVYKYNKHHLIKSLTKQQINEDYWSIELESETL